MDEPDRSWAIAWHDTGVLKRALGTPAESALGLGLLSLRRLWITAGIRVSRTPFIAIFIDIWLNELHLVSFFQILSVDLIFLLMLLFSTYEFLDSELHSTKLYDIEFANPYSLLLNISDYKISWKLEIHDLRSTLSPQRAVSDHFGCQRRARYDLDPKSHLRRVLRSHGVLQSNQSCRFWQPLAVPC